MKRLLKRIINSAHYRAQSLFFNALYFRYWLIYRTFKRHTMIPQKIYINNLRLAKDFSHIPGAIVECGTWRGGMIGGLATVLGNRKYFLFDSFEGLPPAREIDGSGAIQWQNDTKSPLFFDNCTADIAWAQEAMRISGANDVIIQKGWFSDTLKSIPTTTDIAILRLDGDWYDSTMDCLIQLFPLVVKNGVVIIDDYCAWSGCRKAVHDYLSKNDIDVCICQYNNSVTYIKK